MRLGMGNWIGTSIYGAVASAVSWLLRNVLNTSADIGDDATFTRASVVNARVWDATLGTVIQELAVDVPASEGMRFDTGVFYNDDGSGNLLHPVNAAGVMLVFDSWVDATVYPAGAYVVDFVGEQAKYYQTVAGGTSNGTGVSDDIGVTWVLQGNYSNLGGGYLPHLLHELSSTNICLQSEDFSTTWTTGTGAVVTVNQGVAPDGTTTADLISDSAAFQNAQQVVAGAGATVYALSVFFKSASSGKITLRVASGTNDVRKVITLATGAVVDGGGNGVGFISASVIEGSNGWYRCLLFFTSGGAAITCNIYPDDLATVAANNVLAWGAQLKAGLDGSYIKTTTIPVTRAATSEVSTQVIEEQFIRYRITNAEAQVQLSDGTNTFDWDGTDLTFTDGVTTLTAAAVGLAIGDTVVLDQVDGKLYVNGVLKDTDGAIAPTWGAITVINNITDITESSDLDPTDTTWDDA